MGTFISITASSGARIKNGKEEEVKKLIDKYNFGTKEKSFFIPEGLECHINKGIIEIWGYEWPNLWLKPKNGEDTDCTEYFEEFLETLAPYLAEDLIIQSIGSEKCCFPLAAMEIRVTPNGVERGGEFKWSY